MKTVYLNLEDFIANALIEKIETGKGTCITIHQLEEYIDAVKNYLIKKDIEIRFDLTSAAIERLEDMYGSTFAVINHGEVFTLRENKSTWDLRKFFRSYIPLDIVYGLCDEGVCKVLMK